MMDAPLHITADTPPHKIMRSQRWRERRTRFLLPESVIDPSEFSADVIPNRVAAAWLAEHHYLRSMPVTRLSVGLFRNGRPRSRLVGVAAFSVPVNGKAIPLHTGLTPDAGVELGRFALLDEIAANGETFFLRRAFAQVRLAKPQIEAVTAYSDPMPRIGPDGTTTFGGHVGGIYRAFGGPAVYRGQRPRRKVLYTPDGQVFPSRAISKIRNQESGAGYATDLLLRQGAPRPGDADPKAWMAQLVSSGFLTPRWAAGVHAYAFSLTKNARRAAAHIRPPALPLKQPLGDRGDVTGLPLFAR